MNQVFLDTSAAYALLVSSDQNHARAARAFASLGQREAGLTTTSYVLVETYALLMRRVGLAAARAFREDVQPLVEVAWVQHDQHERGLDLVFDRNQGDLSLVDAVSILTMRDLGIDQAFAYDRHFAAEGFDLLG